jgi:oxygen-independent coproporphyrinogen-3 oxidase
LRKNYLPDNKLDTIYFGGGTPSLLLQEDFEKIFDTVSRNFVVEQNAEITLECNPEDITLNYADLLKSFPFNRISIGIQSFNDDELKFLNRRHDAQKAKNSVKILQNHGFGNISVDLMYSLPNQTLKSWQNTINKAINLNVRHISAYSLSYEQGTKLSLLRHKKEISELSQEMSEKFFNTLITKLKGVGLEHYEISNFSAPDFHSRHNSGYWHGANYLGVGASAHSFDGNCRQWNVSDIEKYCKSVENNCTLFEKEVLSETEKYNEQVFLSLRTDKGIDLAKLEFCFGKDSLEYCMQNAEKHLKNSVLELKNNRLKLTERGVFISDGIMSDLMRQ